MESAGLLWFGVFTLTGMWFWALVVAWVAASFAEIHYERPGWATIWMVLFLAALHLGGSVDVIHFVWTHPWLVLGAMGAYVAVGLVWSVIKFKFWLRRQRIRINDEIIPQLRQTFLKQHHVTGGTVMPDLQDDWRRYQEQDYILQPAIRSMGVRENKARLTLWAIWWPISMIWTAISDWVTEIFSYFIFDVLGGYLKRMVDSEKAKISTE